MAHLLLQVFLIFAVFGALNCGPSTSRPTTTKFSSLDASLIDPKDSHHLASNQQGRVARDTLTPAQPHSHDHDGSSSKESKETKEHDISHHAPGHQQSRVARDTPVPLKSHDATHDHDDSSSKESKEHHLSTGQQSRVARDTPVSLEPHTHTHHDGSSSEESKEAKEHDSHHQASGPHDRIARDTPNPPKPHEDDHSHGLHKVTLEKQPLNIPVDANVKRPARATEEKHDRIENGNHETKEILPIPNPAIQPTPLLLPASRHTRDTPVSKNPQQEPINQHQHPQVQSHLTVPSQESEYNRHVRDTGGASSTPQDSHLPVPKPKEESKSDEHKHDHH